MDAIYLCHKCEGALSPCDDPRIYPCGCISGYVRDWQTLTPLTDVRNKQVEALRGRLALYDRQQRAPTDHHVILTNNRLAVWGV